MKLAIISKEKETIGNITKCYREADKKYQAVFELAAYDASILRDEAAILKMYEDIKEADICILDVDNETEFSLLFNAVHACIECKGYVIPSDFKSSIRNFLRIGLLTIEDIISINPRFDMDTNYLLMVKTVQSIEGSGSKVLGRLKDFKNYLLICRYIKLGDEDNSSRLLSLLAEEYGKGFCTGRRIS